MFKNDKDCEFCGQDLMATNDNGDWRKCHEEVKCFDRTFECRDIRTIECRRKRCQG